MSTKFVQQEILAFLSTKEPEVACLRGHWGVGKTYAWNHFLQKARVDNKIFLERYAYVSLFGVNSLEELKFSLFENTVQGSQIGSEPSLQSVRENLAASSEFVGRKVTSFVQQLPIIKNYFGGLGPLWFLSVRKQIICIDDIERRGRGLMVRDVLGLVSFLREQRSCKVMLILNDEALESDKADFETYYEKVVDTTLIFAPTPQECTGIALSSNPERLPFLSETCVALGIPNIRTIKKIERMLRKIEPWLRDMDEKVWMQAVHSTTLFGWAVFDKLTAPPLDYILNRDLVGQYVSGEKAEITEEQAAWNGLMAGIDFYTADDFDLALLEGIRVGFFDREQVDKYAKELDKQFRNDKLHESFKDAWEMFHNSFQPNEDEVVNALYGSVLDHLKGINIINIDATVTLLRDLGRSDLADDLVQKAIAAKNDLPAEIKTGKSLFRRQIKDAALLKEIDQLPVARQDRRSPKDILESLAKYQSWSDSDIDALSDLSAEDYVRIFKESAGKNLKKMVGACLQFRHIVPISEKKQQIVARAEEALRTIANESRINRARVERLGVSEQEE